MTQNGSGTAAHNHYIGGVDGVQFHVGPIYSALLYIATLCPSRMN